MPRFTHIAVLVLATLAAYASSFSGPFIFDDVGSIPENPSIRHLGQLGDVLTPPHADGVTVGGRPFLNLTLAINYAISGTEVWSYHALNLLIHLLAGLTLFGVLRRTLPHLPQKPETRNPNFEYLLAAAIAALWMLHPLQTESVTYIVQRAESLMGLLYLLTLYGFIRAAGEPNSRRWPVVAVGACLLGMATKEVMASAPVIVLLYDRAFLAGSFREALRRRGRLHLAIASTWIVLALLVASGGFNRGGSIGGGVDIGWWPHFLTQFRAVTRYVWLSFWPHPLVFDYGPERITFLQALPYALFIGAIAIVVLRGLWRNTALGFAGALFFAILAPTSLLPGNIQMTVEHRMYLPLAAIVTVVTIAASRRLGGGWGGRRGGLLAAGAISLVFAGLTFARNRDYRTELSIWEDTAKKRPESPVALSAFSLALFHADRLDEALVVNERALHIDPMYFNANNNYGVLLEAANRRPEAIAYYRKALEVRPDRSYARENLANALSKLGRMQEAAAEYEALLKYQPDSAKAHSQLGTQLLKLEQYPAAVEHLSRSVALRPDDAGTQYNLGNALVLSNRIADAIPHFEKALALNPADFEAAANLGIAHAQLGHRPEAISALTRAAELQPNNADIRAMLAQLRK